MVSDNKRALYISLVFSSYLLFIIGTGTIDYVIKFGRYIPSSHIDIKTDYIFGVIWAWILACVINYLPVKRNEKQCLIALWGLKVIVTLGCMLIYEYIYKLDAYGYFIEPLKDDFIVHNISVTNGTWNMFFFAWLHHQIFPDSYHLMKVTFSMFGFVSMYLYYCAYSMIKNKENIYILFLYVLFPSLLFFSSAIGKEALILFSIALYVYGVAGLYSRAKIYYLFPVVIGIGLTILLRYWMGVVLLFPLLIFLLHANVKVSAKINAVSIIIFLVWMVSIPLVYRLNLNGINMFNDFSVNLAVGGSRNAWHKPFTNVTDLVEFIPFGVFAALFRPLPGEVPSIFGAMSGFENLVLLFSVFYVFLKLNKEIIFSPIFQWAVSIILCWLFIYMFVSYFNFGTAMRYKVQILPIILFIILFVFNKRSALND